MSKTTTEVTGARARTQRAILDAAITVLAKDPSASLGDVATAAGVGRTTLHRYFPERSDLLTALSKYALEMVATATERSRLDEGDAMGAIARMCQEYFELGDLLSFIFNEPALLNGPEWQEETEADLAVLAMIRRGQADGQLDSEVSAEWIQTLLWAVLYSSWQLRAWSESTKHDSLSYALRTLDKALAP